MTRDRLSDSRAVTEIPSRLGQCCHSVASVLSGLDKWLAGPRERVARENMGRSAIAQLMLVPKSICC